MQRKDFVQGLKEVFTFLETNGVQITFESGDFFLYLNWTNKLVTIHNAQSSQRAPRGQSSAETPDYLLNPTDNGAWVGPFDSFSKAYTIAALLKKALLFHAHEEVSLGAVGLVDIPYKFL